MEITIIRHEKVDMLWDRKYNSATYDLACDKYDRCPIINNSKPGPLHIWMSTENTEGYIHCENLALLDLSVRDYKKEDSLPISEMINVSDAVQGIFEYI